MRGLVIPMCVALAACGGAPSPVSSQEDAAPAVDAPMQLPACATPGPATFSFEPNTIIASDLVGFGAQFNNNVYAQISAQAGVTPENVVEMEDKVVALGAQHVRIFWNSTATADQIDSFERVVALADRAGAWINVTYWHGPYPDPAGQMQSFANELSHLIHDRGNDRVRYVTIQNEVNSTMVTKALYEQLYRDLDADLRNAGVRDQIKFVCGDLLRDGQASWFDYMATHMTDLCDGYSVHIYWDFFDVAYMVQRLTEVHDLVAALPPNARKPVYVTEFGVRGNRPNNEPAPGLFSDGQLLGRTNENAFQHAWFNVLATRLGFVSTLKWDAFFAKYDLGTQYYSAIGAPPTWTLKPVYFATQLFTRSVQAGWSSVHVRGGDGNADTRLLTAFAGPYGQASVVALNKGDTKRTVDVTGLPPETAVHVLVWHGEGDGDLTASTVTTSPDCKATFDVPARSAVAITTL